jgi:hypothetical protein
VAVTLLVVRVRVFRMEGGLGMATISSAESSTDTDVETERIMGVTDRALKARRQYLSEAGHKNEIRTDLWRLPFFFCEDLDFFCGDPFFLW